MGWWQWYRPMLLFGDVDGEGDGVVVLSGVVVKLFLYLFFSLQLPRLSEQQITFKEFIEDRASSLESFVNEKVNSKLVATLSVLTAIFA